MEQLDYNLLSRWFVGLGVDEAVWVPTVFLLELSDIEAIAALSSPNNEKAGE